MGKNSFFWILGLFSLTVFGKTEPVRELSRNLKIENFSAAKKHLKKMYDVGEGFVPGGLRARDFYCDCPFADKVVDIKACGYTPQYPVTKKGKPNERLTRVEWEHVVPAEAFGQSFKGWRERESFSECKKLSKRACAGRVHEEFAKMEADLYNLVPSIGEVNQLRSNYSMAQLPEKNGVFGKCDLKIEGRKIEPRDAVKGDVARIYMYMDAAYPGHGVISEKNKKLFEAWSKLDPVSEEEIDRAKAIEVIQGNCNSFVLPCNKN